MTKDEKIKCHQIIHAHSAAAFATNAGIPIPGVGIVADMVAFTSMTVQLSLLFGDKLSDNAAKGIAIACIKRYVLLHPCKAFVSFVGKFISYAGAFMSVAMMEACGWMIARDLDRKRKA